MKLGMLWQVGKDDARAERTPDGSCCHLVLSWLRPEQPEPGEFRYPDIDDAIAGKVEALAAKQAKNTAKARRRLALVQKTKKRFGGSK